MIFGKKIEKNNNAPNEFLGINTHENIIQKKKFPSCRGAQCSIFRKKWKKLKKLKSQNKQKKLVIYKFIFLSAKKLI